jgi:hypothetical protein
MKPLRHNVLAQIIVELTHEKKVAARCNALLRGEG